MDGKLPKLDALNPEEKLMLLQELLNDLCLAGVIPRSTLVSVAADVMALDYQEDEDLLCFQCLDHENDEA